jgi:hypothetical protein
VLGQYRLASPGSGWDNDAELLLCPNMRAAEVYLNPDGELSQEAAVDTLLRDSRIDQVIWREHGADAEWLHVRTRDRGTLRFRPASDGRGVADEYDGRWVIHGDLAVVDARVEHNQIRYGVYPNALERVANGVDRPQLRHLWVTARVGYEFQVPGQNPHRGGGSHGTLHELDSLVPLLVAGADLPFSRTPRIVDVAPLCAGLIGVPVETRVGQSHGT